VIPMVRTVPFSLSISGFAAPPVAVDNVRECIHPSRRDVAGLPRSASGPWMDQQPDEQALMAAYAAGDDSAFQPLFRALAPRLLAFFRRSMSDPALCDDLLQTTFVRLHGARHRYRPGAPVRPWVFTIAARVRIDELRRRQRRPRGAHEGEIEQLAAEPDPQQGAFGLDQEARLNSVRAAVDALPEAHRVVIHLHRFEGLSFADIGSALGISAGAARIRAFRAYATLRERLRPIVQEDT
jgi:RNA polymerase sigma factor (sigma-70 family)